MPCRNGLNNHTNTLVHCTSNKDNNNNVCRKLSTFCPPDIFKDTLWVTCDYIHFAFRIIYKMRI